MDFAPEFQLPFQFFNFVKFNVAIVNSECPIKLLEASHCQLITRTNREQIRFFGVLFYASPSLPRLPMKSASLQIQQQQFVNRHYSECLTADNVQLPIYELSQFPIRVDLPLFACQVPAGFPSPADDHLEASIDLNQQYVRHPAATFFVRVQGHSMTSAGIHNGDMLVVDRSLEAQSGSIVIAVINGELTVKRLLLDEDKVWLMPENPEFQPVQIIEGMELHIWGVVAHVIHSL